MSCNRVNGVSVSATPPQHSALCNISERVGSQHPSYMHVGGGDLKQQAL